MHRVAGRDDANGGDYHQHREHVEQDSFKFHNQPEVGSFNQHGQRKHAIHRNTSNTLPQAPHHPARLPRNTGPPGSTDQR
ncbi:hypothetical protein GWL_12140 [Herbaspirillum sp. GW103]|nr:hypothetical protein GWL_12140 [Herbaspirillum sp. GW103]